VNGANLRLIWDGGRSSAFEVAFTVPPRRGPPLSPCARGRVVGAFAARDSKKKRPQGWHVLYYGAVSYVSPYVRCFTPFLTNFGPLLFGRPPASALKDALANLAGFSSLTELRRVF
jgi:hypothetical protein